MTLIWPQNKKQTVAILTISLLLLFLNVFLKSSLNKPSLELSSQNTVINFNEEFVKFFSLGQDRLLSSALWSETLLKAGIKHYKGGDLNNWMFLRLKLITTLDPYFYSAYLYGGIYLSIIKDDDLGAEYIYDKGLKYYPDDLYLNLNASYHYYYELNKPSKSITSLERIVLMPGVPSFIPSFLSRLKAQSESLEDTFVYLRNIIQNYPEGSVLYKRLDENLFNIKTEIDLRCLNERKDNCSRLNYRGQPYLKNKKGLWISPSPWKKIRIKKKDD